MASSPSSKLSFFTHSGVPLQNPTEGLNCGIAVAIPRAQEKSATLKLGSKLLPLWFGENPQCALSAWPACGPGQYKVSLDCGEIRERRIITILPQYFTEPEIKGMMREMTDFLPLAIASRLQKCGGLKGINLVTVHELGIEDEYQRLVLAVRGTKEKPGILQLLPMIQRDCHQTLIPKHELRKVNKARRPDISKLPQAMSMPGNVAEAGYVLQMFDVTVVRSFDTYENSLVKAYVQALQSQLSRLMHRTELEQAAPEITKEIQDLSAEFRLACSRTAFLKQVRQPFVSAGRITMVLLNKPPYRAVLEAYLALFKQVPVRLEDPAINTPLNKFPYLYQHWANLKVVKVLLQICAETGYICTEHKWLTRDSKGYFLGPMKDSTIAIELTSPINHKTVKLIPWSPASAHETADSRQDMPPAMAIGIYEHAKPPVVLVFDPKYRVVGESPEEALRKSQSGKMELAERLKAIAPLPEHIDELRACMEAVKSPIGVREIQYAGILYPGLKKQIASDLEAFPAHPSDGDTLEKHLDEVIRRYLS